MSPRIALLQPLLRPGEYFRERTPRESLIAAAGAVVLTAAVTTAGVAALTRLLTERIDATVTETVTEPWPESLCAGFDEPLPEPCTIDRAVTREVDVGAALWEEMVGYFPLVFGTVVLGWLLIAGGLHVISAIGGGQGSFGGTLAVAGWGMVPTLVDLAAGVLFTASQLQGAEITGDPAAVAAQIRTVTTATTGTANLAVALGVAGWQAYIWAHGLRYARALNQDAAWGIAVLVAVVSFLLSVV